MYKRILIKLSGEWLANKNKNMSIDYNLVEKIVSQVKELSKKKYQIGIVVGGGNFWRGESAEKNGIPRNRADYIGMLATMMNALALQSVFEIHNVKARVQSSLLVDNRVAESYVTEKSIKYLENGEVVIFSAGTGRPYFTTDTATTLVANEIKADVILLGKNNVDGIYDSDPNKYPEAKFFEEISYDEILARNLLIMDSTATSMARSNKLKILVFNVGNENSIINAVEHKGKFTKVVN